jgi:hypothetical protein
MSGASYATGAAAIVGRTVGGRLLPTRRRRLPKTQGLIRRLLG